MARRDTLEPLCKRHGISSHSAKGPLFIRMPNGTVYISLDKKTDAYPCRGFVQKAGFWGGNWNKPEQKRPTDLFDQEVAEELPPLTTLIKYQRAVYEEYVVQVPAEVHGNPNIGLYLNQVTIITAEIDGRETYDALSLSLSATREELHAALTASSNFKCSELFTLDEIRKGRLADEPLFCWGDDVMLEEVLSTHFQFNAQIAKVPRIIVNALEDVHLNAPYKDRWTAQYDRMNPLKIGETPDEKVFT